MASGDVFFDTSALVKLILSEEDGAPFARKLAGESSVLYTNWLTYPETISALSGAKRNGRVNEAGLRLGMELFHTIWPEFHLIDFTDGIADHAGDLALTHPLSGADAVQIASALATINEAKLTFATWDCRQALAADALGLAVQPPIN